MTIQIITKWFSELSRFHKQGIMAAADALMLIFALWSAFSLRLGDFYLPDQSVAWLFVATPFLAVPVFIRFGLYRAIVRYIGFQALWAVMQAVSLYALLWALMVQLSGVEGIPRSVTIINWVVAILLIGGSRMVARWLFSGTINGVAAAGKSARKNVVIYGAGTAGVQLSKALGYSSEFRTVAFIDDNPELHNHQVGSVPVHPFTFLGQLIEKMGVHEVLLAMPSASRARRNEIIQMLEHYPVHVRTLPGMAEIAGGRVKVEDVKEVEIEDLLGRDPVPPNMVLLEANIRGKTVMVTGAGGSIGSELCRQILQQEPALLVLFEQHEYALYDLDKELGVTGQLSGESCNTVSVGRVVPILGSVLDQERMEHICTILGVQTIYHAAAYKHVPMVEKNPVEAIRNNIFGTLRAARAAINTGVETFVLISTDKAVRPTNTMGASKRFAEMVLQGLSRGCIRTPSHPSPFMPEGVLPQGEGGSNGVPQGRGDENSGSGRHSTRFTMVRFGNVLGSSGSVIPLFREQIRKGGPVTVTDPKIIRYFMTIPEAAQLVIQAGAMGQGGDVFVLDMGEPVKILDLAKRMIRLSGLEVKDADHPNGDIEIAFTGLRPGEKLYEELLIGDNVTPTEHPLIMRAEEEELPWAEVQRFLDEFDAAATKHDQAKIRLLLQNSVLGFDPQCGIEDVVYREEAAREVSNIHPIRG